MAGNIIMDKNFFISSETVCMIKKLLSLVIVLVMQFLVFEFFFQDCVLTTHVIYPLSVEVYIYMHGCPIIPLSVIFTLHGRSREHILEGLFPRRSG